MIKGRIQILKRRSKRNNVKCSLSHSIVCSEKAALREIAAWTHTWEEQGGKGYV